MSALLVPAVAMALLVTAVSSASALDVMNSAFGPVSADSISVSDSGPVAGGFNNLVMDGSIIGELPQFSVIGGVLLSATVVWEASATSAGSLTFTGTVENPNGPPSAGGLLDATIDISLFGAEVDSADAPGESCGGAFATMLDCGSTTATATGSIMYISLDPNFSAFLGFGTIDVEAVATWEFIGGCIPVDPLDECSKISFTHARSAAFAGPPNFHVEYAWCEAGSEDCPDPVLGENTPDPTQQPPSVPAPATLALMASGLALTGLMRVRRGR
jgi:hypothetical protein